MCPFNDCVDARTKSIRKTLITKAKEYATTENRFHNFDVAARILDCTPEQALYGMMLKHLVSVINLIDWTETNKAKVTEELVYEKIGDLINYLILLEGLLQRRIAGRGEKQS